VGTFQNDAAINQYISVIRDAIVRYLGTLEEKDDQLRRHLKNPLVWYREGVGVLILSPLLLLAALGLIALGRVWRLAENPLVRTVVVVAALVGLVSSCVTIVVGGPDFVTIVRAGANRLLPLSAVGP
jgi:hypothetical protein